MGLGTKAMVFLLISGVVFLVIGMSMKQPETQLEINQFSKYLEDTERTIDGDYLKTYAISVRISNQGTEDIDNAKLVVELKMNGQVLESGTKSFVLESGWASTETVTISVKSSQLEHLPSDTNIPVVVCTVYAGNQVMDEYTTDW